jgi:hypothetical protein
MLKMKNKKTFKRMLKKNDQPNPPPPLKKKEVSTSTPASTNGLFSVLTQTLGQGMAFGAGSSLGHKTIDAVTGTTSSTTPPSRTTRSINCDDVKKTYELCLETHGFCDQVRTDYIDCLEKAYLLQKTLQ